VITWAASDGREEGGDRVVAAASTIKLFIASAFWRSGLDTAERVEVPPVPWSVADRIAGPVTLADCALLMLAFSDNAATNVLLERLGLDAVNEEAGRLGCERTEVRRPMMAGGPENLTCARDLARGLAAIEAEQVFEALSVAHDSELPLRLHGREVLVKTGEIWPRVYHEAALVDRSLAVAVCSEPAALPGEVAAVADRVIRASLDRG
jgi:beta-lactamase class A